MIVEASPMWPKFGYCYPQAIIMPANPCTTCICGQDARTTHVCRAPGEVRTTFETTPKKGP